MRWVPSPLRFKPGRARQAPQCVNMDVDLYMPAPRRGGGRKRRRDDDDDDDDAAKQEGFRRLTSALASGAARRVSALLKVVTLCSGIEAVIQGYENLMVPHLHVAACEKDKKTRAVIELNYDPATIFEDVCTLKASDVPEHDMMWAGFPCQPFSSDGLRGGLDDGHGRGIILLHIIRLIKKCMPRIVVLENVGGIASRTHRDFFEAALTLLREVHGQGHCYEVEWRLLDTKFFGIPQSRPRVWIVCRRSDVATLPLQWPTPHAEACRTIDTLLGPRPPRSQLQQALPPEILKTFRDNVKSQLDLLHLKGIDPFEETWILDVGHSAARQGTNMQGCSPCLTSTRCKQGGHWISTHGRFFDTKEMLALQHMRHDRVRRPEEVSLPQFHSMIGNSMSVNIIEVLLAMLSRSTPAVFPGPLPDRWSADHTQAQRRR